MIQFDVFFVQMGWFKPPTSWMMLRNAHGFCWIFRWRWRPEICYTGAMNSLEHHVGKTHDIVQVSIRWEYSLEEACCVFVFFWLVGCGGTTKSILHPIDILGKHLHWILQGVEAIGSSYIPVSPDFVHGKTVMQYTNPSPRAHLFHFLHHPIQPTPLFPGSPGWKFGVSSALLLREWLHWRGEFQGRSGISKVIWYEKHYPKPPHLSWFFRGKWGPSMKGTWYGRYIQFFHEKPWLWEEGSEGYVSFHLKSFSFMVYLHAFRVNSRAALLFTMPAQLDRQRLERISQLKKFPWYLVGGWLCWLWCQCHFVTF